MDKLAQEMANLLNQKYSKDLLAAPGIDRFSKVVKNKNKNFVDVVIGDDSLIEIRIYFWSNDSFFIQYQMEDAKVPVTIGTHVCQVKDIGKLLQDDIVSILERLTKNEYQVENIGHLLIDSDSSVPRILSKEDFDDLAGIFANKAKQVQKH